MKNKFYGLLFFLIGFILLAGCGGNTRNGLAAIPPNETAATASPQATFAASSERPGAAAEATATAQPPVDSLTVAEDETYTDKDHVALYLYTFGHLPENYLTKAEARKAGWDSGKNTLAEVLPGKSIGGDRFGNYEGLLPVSKGRSYKECDIDYKKGGRNGKRIVFSSDGLIFYTSDHYESFEQLY